MSTDALPLSEAVTDDMGRAVSAPLRLRAEDGEDLSIVSAALQDAICGPADIVWERRARTLTLTLARFCWECGDTRVRCALQFGDVLAVKSRGLSRSPDAGLELLAIHFQDGEAPGGSAILMFSGGGDLRVDVECVDVVLADLADRWPARLAPRHPDAGPAS